MLNWHALLFRQASSNLNISAPDFSLILYSSFAPLVFLDNHHVRARSNFQGRNTCLAASTTARKLKISPKVETNLTAISCVSPVSVLSLGGTCLLMRTQLLFHPWKFDPALTQQSLNRNKGCETWVWYFNTSNNVMPDINRHPFFIWVSPSPNHCSEREAGSWQLLTFLFLK